ncbi:guanylate-binding protein 1-like [Carcharodon carcharias]|uniref:guanylate-binding protein 1-like n=1 Tax=Carcharodon carcharias TaxID=13397 RepID=UPI001B7DEFA8|nr:guanylate-binding protein 1-like [Carcharodon carcharias]
MVVLTGLDLAVLMPTPVCFIENALDGSLRVNRAALDILASHHEPVVVVSIVGLYRTGKSYLMNWLAGKTQGFPLGSTVQSHTKGIWMWCLPHPLKPNHSLVLLDTEGLGDVSKGDQKNDCWIFALAVLLSSTLVYNSMGTIDQYALEKLYFVTELTELIKVKASDDFHEDDEIEYLKIFPTFVWCIRDFSLELKIEGKVVNQDDYLEHALLLKKGNSKKVMEYNLPRQCIRNFFPKRKCFVFVRPVARDLHTVEHIPEQKLDQSFVQECQRFCKYVHETSQVKCLKGGHVITGRMLGMLASSYVSAIASGAVPCLDDAVTSMARIENAAAVREASDYYRQQMEQLVKMPTETKELSDIHGKCEKEALEVFMQRSFKDQHQEYQQQVVCDLAHQYLDICQKNQQLSVEKCQGLLQSFSVEMDQKLQEGIYTRPGGYQLYIEDRNLMVSKYHSAPGKGIKAEVILADFLKRKQMEAHAILQAEKKLSEAEKLLASEMEKATLMEQVNKAREEELFGLKQLREDERRTNEENLRQMRMKIVEEREEMLKEQEQALESLMAEQKAVLEKGFQEKAELIEEQIQQLKGQEQQTWAGGFVGIIDFIGILRSIFNAARAVATSFIGEVEE